MSKIKITPGYMIEFFDSSKRRQTLLIKKSGPRKTLVENISQPYKCADFYLFTQGVIAAIEEGHYTLLPPAQERNLARFYSVPIVSAMALPVDLEDLTPYQDSRGRTWILLADLEAILPLEDYQKLRKTLNTTELDLALLTPLSPWEK